MNSRIYYIIRACKFLKYSNVNVVINFDTFHRGRIIWDNAMAFNWTTTLTRSKANWDRPMCASVWIDPEIQALFISNLPWTIVITRAIGFRSREDWQWSEFVPVERATCRRRNRCYIQQLGTANVGHLKLVMAWITRRFGEVCKTKAVVIELVTFFPSTHRVTCHLQTSLFDLFLETCLGSRWMARQLEHDQRDICTPI